MLNSTPSKFRSRYTGAEIDSLLTSIQNKIDTSYIVNNFDGGEDLIASAELAKILYDNDQRLNDPNYIQDLILSIPNAVIVTQADIDKLDRLAGAFQGSFADVAARNLGVNTGGFKGGELTFLINDGHGQQELSYWSTQSLTWVKASFLPSATLPPINSTVGGTVAAVQLDTNKFSLAKYIVKLTTSTELLVFELLVAVRSGVDTYWTTQGYIGTNSTLGKVLSCSIASNTLNVNVQVPPNSTLTFSKILEV
jgi:hypothetical protein